MGKKHGEKAKR